MGLSAIAPRIVGVPVSDANAYWHKRDSKTADSAERASRHPRG
jgi:hypothetical protein